MRRPAVIAMLLALAAAVALSLPAAAPASTSQTMIFEGGADALSDSTRDDTLDQVKAFGVHQLRVIMYWSKVAPDANSSKRPTFDASDPGTYPADNWGQYDRLLAAARARGLSVLLTISGPVPRWATSTKKDHLTRPSAKEFGQFVTAVGRRYGDQISMWSIWNEPNHPDFLRPQFVKHRATSPRIYRGLYRAALGGLAASGNGADTVLIGETAPRGTPRVVAPLPFLRGVLCLSKSYHRDRRCGPLHADGYAHHAYTTRAGPSFRPDSADDVTIGVLGRLTKALDRAARTGAIRRGLPLYLTEFGVQSKPDPFLGVSLSQQAEFRSIAEYIAYRNPRVKLFSQYLMRDDQPRSGSPRNRYSGFESGLRLSSGGKKPSYDAFRLPLVVQRRARTVRLWGLVRPATKPVTITVEYLDRGASAWKVVGEHTTDPSGYWVGTASYVDGRRWRTRWTSGDGIEYVGPATHAY